MKVKKLPFNIGFFPDKPVSYLGMIPITTLQIFEGKNGDYHPGGLYSNLIFGKQGEPQRDSMFSFIDLKVPVFHPLYYQELISLKKLYAELVTGKGYAIWDDVLKDFVRSDIMEGETGFAFFMRYFDRIEFKRNSSKARDLKIDFLEKFRKQRYIEKLIVIPAGLRDIELREDGQPVEEELNPLYRRVLSIANTINVSFDDRNNEILDRAKASMQLAILEIYTYLFKILEGKKGFFKGKLASRRITGSTRNVLSSMEAGSESLESPRQPSIDTVHVGLFQTIKGIEPYITEFALKNKFLEDFMRNLNSEVELVDRKTHRAIITTLTPKTRDKWGTADGLSSMINTFGDAKLRHRPVMVDGHYLKLVYQDDKHYRVMGGIGELPDNKSVEFVHPMTWAELWYLLIADFMSKTRAFVTRYPIMETGSINPLKPYVKTTVRGLKLTELGENWEPTDKTVWEYPDTISKLAFFETMSVPPFLLPGYGADFDGDTLSMIFVYSREGRKAVDDYINNKNTYIRASGGLTFPITSDVTDWVLSFMTGD